MATEPIQINVNPERDGCYYELGPHAWYRVQNAAPDQPRAPLVFIGYASRDDFEALHAPMWPMIATALTGMSWDEIVEMGGIELFDVTTHTYLRHLPERDAA